MITLYIPKLEDLWFREEFMSDTETMSYNQKWGGTIPFPKKIWENWYRYWITEHENKRFYRYLLEEDSGEFVGEVAYHYDEEEKKYLADIIVYAKYRGRGFGKKGLSLLVEEAREKGIDFLYDNIAINNSSVKLFLENGFVEDCRTEEVIMLKKKLKEKAPSGKENINQSR